MNKKDRQAELIGALNVLEKEKGIKKDVIVDALETALETAYKQNYGEKNVEVDFNDQTGEIKVYAVKTVVDTPVDPDDREHINLDDALKISKGYEVGDEIREEVTPANFGRIAAQTAKQVVLQRLHEEERRVVYEKYKGYENEIITGEVSREDSRFVYVNLGDNVEGVMGHRDQLPSEHYRIHDRIQVYVSRVEDNKHGPQIFVSRTAPELLKRLFEREVPEVHDGTVLIENIAREAGDRAKVAVYSNDPNVDAVGTCVGPRGSRVQAIVNELDGENMDIVEWVKDPAQFIANALNPAEVLDVIFDKPSDESEGTESDDNADNAATNDQVDSAASEDSDESEGTDDNGASDEAEDTDQSDDQENQPVKKQEQERSCTVVVPDDQLSLAIGKRGQNARLAAKLTKYRIDIKAESEMEDADEKSDDEAADSTPSADDAE